MHLLRYRDRTLAADGLEHRRASAASDLSVDRPDSADRIGASALSSPALARRARRPRGRSTRTRSCDPREIARPTHSHRAAHSRSTRARARRRADDRRCEPMRERDASGHAPLTDDGVTSVFYCWRPEFCWNQSAHVGARHVRAIEQIDAGELSSGSASRSAQHDPPNPFWIPRASESGFQSRICTYPIGIGTGRH
jgi:hypothetical protein